MYRFFFHTAFFTPLQLKKKKGLQTRRAVTLVTLTIVSREKLVKSHKKYFNKISLYFHRLDIEQHYKSVFYAYRFDFE